MGAIEDERKQADMHKTSVSKYIYQIHSYSILCVCVIVVQVEKSNTKYRVLKRNLDEAVRSTCLPEGWLLLFHDLVCVNRRKKTVVWAQLSVVLWER